MQSFMDSFFGNFISVVLLAVLILLAGCAEEEHITEVNFEEAEFGDFVEKDFPFITTSLDARNLGPDFPAMNITPRCLALQLGNDAYTCFDTDMLRWSVAWTGEFLPMVTMAQISYRDFFNKDNQIPTILGDPKIATGHYPGWAAGALDFTDPREPSAHPDEPSWGPMPQELGRWNGVYVSDDGPVLSYTIQNVDIYEMPSSIRLDGETLFARSFRVDESDVSLSMVAAEITNASRSEIQSERAEIYHNDEETMTIVQLSEDTGSVNLNIEEERYITVTIPERADQLEFTVLIWTGDVSLADEIMSSGVEESFEFPAFREGGSNIWQNEIKTTGRISPDTSAYVIDELTLPIPNPWGRNVRVVDLDFFDDGRAAVVTFEGDVWIVNGIDRELRSLSWSRFASGLYEPQSIEIVDGQIYTYGKEGIVRLHDLNGDGAADFYENFSNLITQSIETREWASDMVAKPDGGFYVAKGGALDMGPRGLTDPITSGFRSGSRHTGVVLDVSADGRSAEQFASGFRGPYLGIHPEIGLLTASDQQGHFVPSTPLFIVEEGDFAGVEATAHRNPIPEPTPPLLWIPHKVDRSGLSQAWLTGDQMGPLNNNLIHFSYGQPGLFKIFIDSTDSGLQGGISVIPGEFSAPTMKGVMSPVDGQLYIAGFTLWGTNSDGVSALARLRYTGMDSMIPESFKVRDGGVILRFNQELDEDAVTELSNYRVQRWNYLRTEEYGSGHYRLDGTPGQELLPVFSAQLSDDQKGLFLAIPNINEVQQMELSYQIKTADGRDMVNDFWFTVHHVEPIDLASEGFSDLDIDELLAGNSSEAVGALGNTDAPVTAERGEELFMRTGCMGCHTIDGSVGTGVGPTMEGLYGSERSLQDGSTAVADEQYLRQALTDPGEQITEGYDEGMPSFLGILSDDDIDSIVLYIKSLSE